MKFHILLFLCLSSLLSVSQGAFCNDADPFCSDNSFVFPNVFNGNIAESGPDYGCLAETPNPAWYFFGIDTTGAIDFLISQEDNFGTPIDVDFICYGPFVNTDNVCNNLTSSKIIACSYSPDAEESFSINNAQIGEFYIVLITNFDGSQGTISLGQTNVSNSDAGSTDCQIVCSVELPEDQVFCHTNPYRITSELGNASMSSTATYKWFKNNVEIIGESNSFLDINFITSSTIPDIYKIIVTADNCDVTAEDEIEISYLNQATITDPMLFFDNPEPSFLTDETIIFCLDESDEITLSINLINNNVNDFNYTWSNGAISSSINVNTTNDYSVNIFNPLNCKTLNKVFHITASKIFINDEPNFIDETLFYCINDFPETTTLITGINNNSITNYNIEWFNSTGNSLLDYPNNSISPDLFINQSGDYTVIVTNALGCHVSRTITVKPTSIANFTKVLITENEFYRKVSVIVEVSGFGYYQYAIVDPNSTDINNDDIYQNENVFENINYGKHKLLVRDINSNGCDEILKKIIFILDYPKFITPNNDGIHDTWNIDNLGAYNNEIISEFNTTTNVTIFDRVGRLIATIDPKGLGWNGKFKGEPLPDSDYWFVVKFIDFTGKTYTKKGHFSLQN